MTETLQPASPRTELNTCVERLMPCLSSTWDRRGKSALLEILNGHKRFLRLVLSDGIPDRARLSNSVVCNSAGYNEVHSTEIVQEGPDETHSRRLNRQLTPLNVVGH